MSLNELYQQTIKQHNLNPCGLGKIENADIQLRGYNPSCGDELEVYLNISQSDNTTKVNDIGFEADACAICQASLSLMCQHSQNKNAVDLLQDIQQFEDSLKHDQTSTIDSLQCLTAVKRFPSRVNCALLPWQTLRKILLSKLPNQNEIAETVDA